MRTERVATEVIRIEKVIVTETETFTVEVRREELRLTRTPATAGNTRPSSSAAAGPIVLTLHEERVTLATRVVPVETVTIAVTEATTTHTIRDLLHHEQVDIDLDTEAH